MRAEIREKFLQAKEHQRLPAKLSKVSKEAWNMFPLTALRREKLCQHLDLSLLAARTPAQCISVV